MQILPTPENGCSKAYLALAHHVTTASKHRVSMTSSRITDAELAEIRRLIATSIGLEP